MGESNASRVFVMQFLHELSESAKAAIDKYTVYSSATAGAIAAATLSQAALVISCIAGLLTIAWYCVRFYDRFKHGPNRGE